MGKVDMQQSAAILLSIAPMAIVSGVAILAPLTVAAVICLPLVFAVVIVPVLFDNIQARYSSAIVGWKLLAAYAVVVLSVRWAYAGVSKGRQDVAVRSDPPIDWLMSQPDVLVLSAVLALYLVTVAFLVHGFIKSLKWLFLSHSPYQASD